MKMSKILSLILVVVMLFSMTSCDAIQGLLDKILGKENPAAGLEGTYDVTLWVSEKDGVADLTAQQIDAFEAEYKGIVINASIEGVSEANAAGEVLNDVASAPDIYCFAQDQLARLVQASALSELGTKAAETVKANNDTGAVAAGTVAGKLYAYPMTSDNGYYLYYDKSIITNPESLEDIIRDCEASGKKFRYALENGWYTASFFFATGCVSEWTMDENGKFTSVNDNFNSDAGLVAMKGMQKLAQSSCYDSNADIFTDAGAIVTGIWNATAAEEHFGLANLGATDLPSFTVDGQSYHLGSFTGNKLMGIKPQTDPKKGAVLHLLAQWLTNEDCQMDRYNQYQWGPSNKAAQASPEVQSNKSLAALALQGNYGRPQGQIHGSWWDIASVLGADARTAKDEAALQASLAVYASTISGLFQKTPEELRAWGVIGGIQDTGWKVDFKMTEVSPNVWESDALTLTVGTEFKLRQGGSWTVQAGADNDKTGETTSGYYVRLQDNESDPEPSNIVSEVAGSYKIRFTWEEGTHNCTVEFIPAE